MLRFHKEPLKVLQSFFATTGDWVCDPGWKYACLCVSSYLAFPFATYWVAAGVMSSIGFGTGFQTGSLILFPYIADIASTEDTFLAAGEKVLLPTFLWGIGSALGEIPPYFAASVLMQQDHLSKALEKRILRLLDRFGAIGIFLLACYPNATFDVAGVLAGVSSMPFWKFLVATCAGKAFVKAPSQAAFVIWTTQSATELFSGSGYDYSFLWLRRVWRTIASLVIAVTTWYFVEAVANWKKTEERSRSSS